MVGVAVSLNMILGSLIVTLICLISVQAREIFSFHDQKVANSDHDLPEAPLENSELYAYDVDHERDHLNVHVFVNAEARNALSDPASLWPDGKILYKLSDKYDSEEKETILEAMEEFKNRTCIRFEPREKEETPFILIEPGSGCSTTVDKNEEGKVSLGKGCNDKGIIIHELMHTLGFLHEHSLPDRDDYVEINWENIEEKNKKNFKKNSFDGVEDGNINYDYNKIMHYEEHNFAKNRSIPTIITLKENVKIGQRNGFSENDIAKVLERYGCKKAGTDPSDKTRQKPPTQTIKNPAQINKYLVKLSKNPAQSSKNPPRSTKMITLATGKKTTGDWQSSHAATITRKTIAGTTDIQMTAHTKNKGKTLPSKLVKAISKLMAAYGKMTPSRTTMVKLALRFSTKTKMAAESQKPKTSHTTLPKATSSYISGVNRRYKRHVPQPVHFSAHGDEEVEAPQISETLEAEAPQIAETLEAEAPQVADTLEVEAPQVAKALEAEAPHIAEISEAQSPLVLDRLRGENKFVGRRASTVLDDFRERLVEFANQYWWNYYLERIQEQKTTMEPVREAIVEVDPLLSQQIKGTSTETVNFESTSTLGSMSPITNSSKRTKSESVIFTNSDLGSSTPEIPTTTKSGAIAPKSTTTDSSSATDNSSESPSLESMVLTSSDSGRSTSESPTPSIVSTEKGNSESNTESEGKTENSLRPKTELSEVETSKIIISTTSVLDVSVPESKSSIGSTSTGISSESMNPDTMSSELTSSKTMGSMCESLRKTTLGHLICLSSDPGPTDPESTSSKDSNPGDISSEIVNSDAMASKLTTESITSLTTESPGKTILDSLISTSEAPCSANSKSRNCEVNPDSQSSTEILNTTPNAPCENKCVKNHDSVDESTENVSPNVSGLENSSMGDQLPEASSTKERFKGSTLNDEFEKPIAGNVDTESDSTVATTFDLDTKANTLPFEFTFEANKHFRSYHKVSIYQSLQGRTALSNPENLWPDGIVPYEFSDEYDDNQKGFILEGMEAFKNETCVRFEERKNETSFIKIAPGDNCQSVVGRQPEQNNVTLSEGCYLQGTIIHELMHSLGFIHEHSRPDRDSYIIVIWDNIIEGAESNFKKLPEDKVTALDVGYDYDSVMHYSAYEFSKDPDRPTLVPLQAGVKIGDKDGFSKKDVIKINKLYNCSTAKYVTTEDKSKKDGAEDVNAPTQALFQNVLKYFEMNFQRLFRSILRTIQKFRPTILNTKPKA